MHSLIIGLKKFIKKHLYWWYYCLYDRYQPKIFCIGFNKTGTTSINRALAREGVLVGNQLKAEQLADDYISGKLDSIYKYCNGARAFQDSPFSFPGIYVPLYKKFPKAKFILTVRDSSEQWLESQFNFTIKRKGALPNLEELKYDEYCNPGWTYRVHQFIYGIQTEYENRERKIQVYEKHNRDVQKFFKANPEQLLVLNLNDNKAFQIFCEFLNIQSKYGTFPWANKTS